MRRSLQWQVLSLLGPGTTGPAGLLTPTSAMLSADFSPLVLCRTVSTARTHTRQGLDNELSTQATLAAQGKKEGLSPEALLARFQHFLRPTPPVRYIKGMSPPTAMSWMRRRGPEVPHTLLHRLFRQRQIRLFDGSRVTRVSASRALRNGDRLLFPTSVTSAHHHHHHRQRDGGTACMVAQPAAAAGKSGAGVGSPSSPPGDRRASHGGAGLGPGSSRSGGAAAVVDLSPDALVRRALFSPPPDGADAAARPSSPTNTARPVPGIEDVPPDEADLWYNQAERAPAPPSAAPPPAAPPVPARIPAAAVLTPERVRRWVLGVHPGLVFVNKPAGVRVHGRSADDGEGRRVGQLGGAVGGGRRGPAVARHLTLDDMLQAALRFGEADEPRLVHRLDQQASGVMVVARDADAATWLSAAFQNKAQQAARADRKGRRRSGFGGPGDDVEDEEYGEDEEEAPGRGRRRGADGGPVLPPDLYVRRTYWAFVAGDLQPRQSGTIKYPIVVDGQSRPALTSYRVKATGCGVSWVELSPETGRRHQLRIHCARKLGAPIIGDGRYGYRGLPARLSLRDRLPPEWWTLLGERPAPTAAAGPGAWAGAAGGGGEGEVAGGVLPPPILLHARELFVKRPGKAPLVAVAPLPRYIRELIQAAGWQQPTMG